MNPRKPTIITDGGPWAEHDMACAVCRDRSAILDLNTGRFIPCDMCSIAGWRLLRRPWWWPDRWWRYP